MKTKNIRIAMTNARCMELTGRESHGDIALPEISIDLDSLTPAARFVAEHITSTRIVDEYRDRIDVIAVAGYTMAERDRKAGKSEDYIKKYSQAYGEDYDTVRMSTKISFPIFGKRHNRPEDVIEEAVRQLINEGVVSLVVKNGPTYMVSAFSDAQFSICWQEAANYTDADAYISDMALSAMWGDAEGAEIPQERIDQLRRIWDAYHMDARQIRAASGLTQAAFSKRFLIPMRTVGNWDTGVNAPPDYVKVLILRQLGKL